MKRLFLAVICAISFTIAAAQQPPAARFDPIPENVTTSTQSIAHWLLNHHQQNQVAMLKSIFGWMAANIKYDLVNTFQPDYYKDTADAVNKTLRTRTAICHGYASLFLELARQANIPAELVGGYTFSQGKLDNSSHAWVAVFVNNAWQLIDPTWGSGSITDGQYKQQINWNYFLAAPESFIKTHVPFDPLFQFLNYPWSHTDIAKGNQTTKSLFRYADTLAAFNKLTGYERAENAAARIGRYGVTNQLIGVELQHLANIAAVGRQNMMVDNYNDQVNKVNRVGNQFNEVVASYNEYVEFKNHQFTPSKPDEEIKSWVDEMGDKLKELDVQLAAIQPANKTIANNIGENKAAVNALQKKVTEEQVFVAKYIKTGKLLRKTLFYKIGR